MPMLPACMQDDDGDLYFAHGQATRAFVEALVRAGWWRWWRWCRVGCSVLLSDGMGWGEREAYVPEW